MLHWLGAPASDVAPSTPSAEELQSLQADLLSDSEPARIAAAYSLGGVARHTDAPSVRRAALASLAGAMSHKREAARRAASFGFATAGPEGVELLLAMLRPDSKAPDAARKYVLWSLGEAGVASEEVLTALFEALASKAKDWSYKAQLEKETAVAALGLLGARAARGDAALFAGVCEVLVAAAGDKTEEASRVREEAALALLLACVAAPATAAAQDGLQDLLTKLLDDEDRYVLGFATEALRSLADGGSSEAAQALRTALKCAPGADLARLVRCEWCSRTSPEDPY
eukprot:NODE_1331_length_1173_cov_721.823792.p2 GENE.NODE_1331_length_1173_cov_721.823792~~NODE_1331_length_1173_cov_721.823792.p2  ORF type:complete len:313 (+),score=67.22 NODE_1331_length_1173_cov_721.823792:82-939(+)